MKKHQAPSKQTSKTSTNPVQPKVSVPSKATVTDSTNSKYKYIDPKDVHAGGPKWFSKEQIDYCKNAVLQAYQHGKPQAQQPSNPQVRQYFIAKIKQKFGQNLQFRIEHLKIYNRENDQKIQKQNGQTFIIEVNKYPNFMFSFWKPI